MAGRHQKLGAGLARIAIRRVAAAIVVAWLAIQHASTLDSDAEAMGCMPEVVRGVGSGGRAGGGARSGLGWFWCDVCIGPYRSREAQSGGE